MNRAVTTPASRKSFRTLTVSAMFAAMIALTTAYLFHIPVGFNGGYIHFGDAFIYLAAALLPTPYACATAAVGGGLADFISGVPIWVLPTMLIKPLTAVWFTSREERLLCSRNLWGLLFAGAVSNTGYYLVEVLLTGNWAAPLVTIWGGMLQAVGSAVIFVVMAAALDRLGIKKQLGLQ